MPDETDHREFELDPESYDALIDWPRRLANEERFYRGLFSQVGVRSVLDAACGTGHHAAMFHAWGLRVQGADLSSAMIDYCRGRHGESDALRWVERSFVEPASPTAAFDAVICTGNSLATVPDIETAESAVGAMLQSIRPGGLCVIQVLNLSRLPEGPTVWQKCCRLRREGGDQILLKSLHRVGARGYIDVVDLRLVGEELEERFHVATILDLSADALQRAVDAAGGGNVRLYGNYQEEPYDPASSADLILVCRRRVVETTNPAIWTDQS